MPDIDALFLFFCCGLDLHSWRAGPKLFVHSRIQRFKGGNNSTSSIPELLMLKLGIPLPWYLGTDTAHLSKLPPLAGAYWQIALAEGILVQQGVRCPTKPLTPPNPSTFLWSDNTNLSPLKKSTRHDLKLHLFLQSTLRYLKRQ